MKSHFKSFALGLSLAFVLGSTVKSDAFALLGPVQPWMQASNGVIVAGDIGGPMCLSNEYRWNVPAVTYGFDKSFLDFFGTNGVAAVESAIQILNDLPPASHITLMNYPFKTQQVNYAAQGANLNDLKSETLSLLLEQMGLTKPTRYVFVLKQWDPILATTPSMDQWPEGTIPNYIVQRNFDPQTLGATNYVNHASYTGLISVQGDQQNILISAQNPLNDNPSVADFNLSIGGFYSGLTYDDVGGLAYLLSTNNINYENLLPGIYGVGTNSGSIVNGAWRPGVDKITFSPQPTDSEGTFLALTNTFTDHYLTNGVWQQQQVARVISQPDFVFSANDVGSSASDVIFFTRTGTTNWSDNAVANGNTNGAGPGVIQPHVQIVFNKLGRQFVSLADVSDEQVNEQSQFWGSFDDSTNVPVTYPITQTGVNPTTIIRMWLSFAGKTPRDFTWTATGAAGSQFSLQTSTDLASWVNLFTITNDGSVCTYLNENPTSTTRFYRLAPQ
ncbi:MAG TPA: hypothetical protein VGO57_03845 [Verrucomicrobiae bacterium]